MKHNRTTAASAAALLGLSALGAAASLAPASASNQPGDWHVTRLVSKTIRETQVGQTRFVGTDVVRSGGKVIGYNSLSGQFLPDRNRVIIRFGLALKGGVIMGRVTADEPRPGQDIRFTGPIQSGSGRYAGIEGRVVAVVAADDTAGVARVTLRWRT